MAAYQEFKPESDKPAAIYKQIGTLLVGAYSVEVVPRDDTVILRVWLTKHCKLGDHKKVKL